MSRDFYTNNPSKICQNVYNTNTKQTPMTYLKPPIAAKAALIFSEEPPTVPPKKSMTSGVKSSDSTPFNLLTRSISAGS